MTAKRPPRPRRPRTQRTPLAAGEPFALRRRLLLAGSLLPWLPPAAAAITARPVRIAWVTTERKGAPSPNLEAFKAGLLELRYVEGRDYVVEIWSGDGRGEEVERLVPEILAKPPDILVGVGGLAVFPLIRAGTKVPLVFSISADPVEAGIVPSYARPGGTFTGISLFTLALVGKRLEIIREILPGVRKVALLANPQHPGERLELAAAREAAAPLGIAIDYYQTRSDAELDRAFAEIARTRPDAILAFADGFTLNYAANIAAFSLKTRIPAFDGWAPFARRGNLLTYGPVIEDVYRRLADYVDRIVKGAKPGDLPIELPTKVELVVNLRTAKALGITIPSNVLARADEVIR